MRVFITGASGFIGSYLLRDLINAGHEILALKRPTTNLYRVADCQAKVKWIEDSLPCDHELIGFKPEVIFHLAWKGVSAVDRTDWSMQESNIQILQRMLDVAARCGTKKFIGVGSQAEYGIFDRKVNEDFPANPNSAYGAIKYACLTILKTYCELHHIDWYWFRVFPCYGPTEDDNWLIPSLIKSIYTSDHMDLTPGEQKLAYLYVGEVARAISSAISDNDVNTGVYNISSDNPVHLKELVTYIRDKVNPSFKLNFGTLPYRQGQCMYMEGDTTKLRRYLYTPDTSTFTEKLIETIDYYIKRYSDGHQKDERDC